MPLDASVAGKAMAQAAKAAAAAVTPGTKITDKQLEDIEIAKVTALFTHLTTNGVVLPGTFATSQGPVLGTGKIS